MSFERQQLDLVPIWWLEKTHIKSATILETLKPCVVVQ